MVVLHRHLGNTSQGFREPYRRAISRQGVPPDLLGRVLEIGLVEGALPSLDLQKEGSCGIKLIAEGARGELRLGGSFASEVTLEKSAEPA